jgi:DNA repair exonuclease SbcCD ATPase subunit
MTDKQIIIDGVDVSGCEHLYREIDCLAHMDYSECCEGYDPSYGYCPNTDCYYKQLKRKEQECEELKKIIDEAKNSKLDLKSFLVGEAIQNEYEQQLDQLKAEVKSKTEYVQEQREIINQYSKEIEMYKKCQGKRASKREEELKTENKHLNDLLNQALKELEKTRETLTEIKEIAEICKCHNADGCYECKYFDDCEVEDEEIPTRDVCKLILQKISEVEE